MCANTKVLSTLNEFIYYNEEEEESFLIFDELNIGWKSWCYIRYMYDRVRFDVEIIIKCSFIYSK